MEPSLIEQETHDQPDWFNSQTNTIHKWYRRLLYMNWLVFIWNFSIAKDARSAGKQAGRPASQCVVYAIFAGVNQMGSKPWNEYREYMECLLVYSLFSDGKNCNHVIESTWFVIYTIAIGAWESGRSCTMQMQFFHYFDWQTSRRIQSRELVAINLWCAIIFVLINCVGCVWVW